MPSYGYDGPVTADAWAKMQQGLALDYSCADVASAKVSANTSGCQVAAGTLGGWGVLDVLATSVQVNLTAPGSGTAWWMIVARRTWGSTKATTFVAITAGTSRPAMLPTRNTAPGTVDDQPLALIGWTAGQSQPQSLVDLRAVGMAGEQVIFDAQSMQYLTRAGRRLNLSGIDWVCVWSSTTLKWISGASGTASAISPAYTPAAGWTVDSVSLSAEGRAVHLYANVTRTGAAITVPASGNITNSVMLNIEAQYRPPITVALASGVIGPMGAFYMDTNGDVGIAAVPKGSTIPTGVSLSCGGTWLR